MLHLPLYTDADASPQKTLALAKRLSGFAEVVEGLAEPQVRYEGRRKPPMRRILSATSAWCAVPSRRWRSRSSLVSTVSPIMAGCRYARQIEQAGARAIELNIYFLPLPTNLELSGGDSEQRYLDIVAAVKAAVKGVVAVKIGPYFSAVGHTARRLDQAGADGLVLFNRFYEAHLELSSPYEIRLPLLWIAVLSGQVMASLAASTGVDSVDEVVKYLLVGADVADTAVWARALAGCASSGFAHVGACSYEPSKRC